jgi:hypothetical protein
VLQILSEVDGGHPATSELALDDVTIAEGFRQLGRYVGHVDAGAAISRYAGAPIVSV